MRLFLQHRDVVSVTEAVRPEFIGATHFELRTRFSIDSTDLKIEEILAEFRRDAEAVFSAWWMRRGLEVHDLAQQYESTVLLNGVTFREVFSPSDPRIPPIPDGEAS